MNTTWIKQLKSNSRKVVQSPHLKDGDGKPIEYTIRKLSQTELLKAKLSVVLAPEKAASVIAIADNQEARLYESVQFCLRQGVLNPKISYEDEAQIAEDAVHISWISEDEMWLPNEICNFSGIGSAAQARVEEFAKNGTGSASSTPSGDVTTDSLPN